MKKRSKNLVLQRKALALGLSVALFLGHQTHAYAEDPFQLDTGKWMSFEHYKDADARGLISKPSPKIEPPAIAPTEVATTTPSSPVAPEKPSVAPPARALDLPVMPALNKGFSLEVNSTEDDHLVSHLSDVKAAKADIRLQDKDWQSPTMAVKAHDANEDDGSDEQEVHVRMSYLPDAKVAPIPSPEHASNIQAARFTLEKMIADKDKSKKDKAAKEKTPEEVAACAALDAYKKQQLTAIQSDRETLKALQDAIASLGLQKELGFMTGNSNTLNAQGAKMDMPIGAPIAPPSGKI